MRLPLMLALLLPLFAANAGDRVYHYATADGVPLFTDRKMPGAVLVKVKYYGRPTAVTGRCKPDKQRMRRYRKVIRRLARKHHVDEKLVQAVITTESCYNPRAVSRVGAKGLMQLMPETAAMLGVDDPFDPEQNIAGGIRYLRMMLDEFDHNQKLALAAYNAGPAAVHKYGDSIPPYRETRDYVRKILKLLN